MSIYNTPTPKRERGEEPERSEREENSEKRKSRIPGT
jgi:hypothetical protein